VSDRNIVVRRVRKFRFRQSPTPKLALTYVTNLSDLIMMDRRQNALRFATYRCIGETDPVPAGGIKAITASIVKCGARFVIRFSCMKKRHIASQSTARLAEIDSTQRCVFVNICVKQVSSTLQSTYWPVERQCRNRLPWSAPFRPRL
jgi:hypothetical protein